MKWKLETQGSYKYVHKTWLFLLSIYIFEGPQFNFGYFWGSSIQFWYKGYSNKYVFPKNALRLFRMRWPVHFCKICPIQGTAADESEDSQHGQKTRLPYNCRLQSNVYSSIKLLLSYFITFYSFERIYWPVSFIILWICLFPKIFHLLTA